eukprot:2814665-Amphidinium_carterae.1
MQNGELQTVLVSAASSSVTWYSAHENELSCFWRGLHELHLEGILTISVNLDNIEVLGSSSRRACEEGVACAYQSKRQTSGTSKDVELSGLSALLIKKLTLQLVTYFKKSDPARLASAVFESFIGVRTSLTCLGDTHRDSVCNSLAVEHLHWHRSMSVVPLRACISMMCSGWCGHRRPCHRYRRGQWKQRCRGTDAP